MIMVVVVIKYEKVKSQRSVHNAIPVTLLSLRCVFDWSVWWWTTSTFPRVGRVIYKTWVGHPQVRGCFGSSVVKSFHCCPFIKIIINEQFVHHQLYGSSATINEFVSTTTKGLIPNLVSPDDMVDAIMMLINAAYFKGTWRYQFKPSHTQPRQFFVSPGHSVDVAMMRIKTKLRLGKVTSPGEARPVSLYYRHYY